MKYEIRENVNAQAFIVYKIIDSCEKTTVATFYYDFGVDKEEIRGIVDQFVNSLNNLKPILSC